MPLPIDSSFWNELLLRIRTSKVIPVLGAGAISRGASDDLVYPELLQQLASAQGIASPAHPPATLSGLVRNLERAAGRNFSQEIELLRMNLLDGLDAIGPDPGPSLRLLASVSPFKLFLAATPDSLLANALDVERPPPAEDAISTSQLGTIDDLPVEFADLRRPYVYPLFGRAAQTYPVALGEEAAFEFLLNFGKHLENCGKLQRGLKDANFLFIGLSHPEWLLRLLVRFADGKPLGERDKHVVYLADEQKSLRNKRVIAFFNPHAGVLKVVPVESRRFIGELVARWRADEQRRQPARPAGMAPSAKPYTAVDSARPGCIFISFATADLAAALQVANQLKAAGGFVWLDRWNLGAGEKWDLVLKDAVTKRCGVFVSLISQRTEVRIEGYYLKERNWAALRYEGFAQRAKFYFPVRIDAGKPIPDNEPIVAADFQARIAIDGILPPDLASAILEAQRTYCEQQGLKIPPRQP